jgi:hypothetical protein
MLSIRTFPTLFLALLILTDCSSLQTEEDESPLASANEIPAPSRKRLWNAVVNRFTLKNTISIETKIYFENIITRLYLKENLSTFSVSFIQERTPSFERLCWVLPRKGALIDTSIFPQLNGEHEIAALIAFGYERARLTTFQDRLVEAVNPVDIETSMLINFLTEEDVIAIRNATDVIYQAGYDPRGMIGILEKFPEMPDGKIKLLKDATQQRIFKYPPLVNPAVRTNGFYKFQQEIGKN